jgi:hypothetical protein
MPPGAVRLSKSRVMAGLEPHEALQAVFDEGTHVGEVARTYVSHGVLIDLSYNAYDERVEATAAALQRKTPVICEASFRAGQVFVS